METQYEYHCVSIIMSGTQRLKNLDIEVVQHVDQKDKGKPDQAVVIIAGHLFHQGDSQALDLK